jgi:hypothetical protein
VFSEVYSRGEEQGWRFLKYIAEVRSRVEPKDGSPSKPNRKINDQVD